MVIEFANSDAGKFLLESKPIEKETKQHLTNFVNMTASYHAREQQIRIEVVIF